MLLLKQHVSQCSTEILQLAAFCRARTRGGSGITKLPDNFRIFPNLQTTDQYGRQFYSTESRDMLEIGRKPNLVTQGFFSPNQNL